MSKFGKIIGGPGLLKMAAVSEVWSPPFARKVIMYVYSIALDEFDNHRIRFAACAVLVSDLRKVCDACRVVFQELQVPKTSRGTVFSRE